MVCRLSRDGMKMLRWDVQGILLLVTGSVMLVLCERKRRRDSARVRELPESPPSLSLCKSWLVGIAPGCQLIFSTPCQLTAIFGPGNRRQALAHSTEGAAGVDSDTGGGHTITRVLQYHAESTSPSTRSPTV
ncbi:hypothetical protein PISMIDRAFT_685462 [Pisolithus microcarpus 441]|uniref:Uncharacterized protein n=1 Tax=Pisolithus microcarpus 441 TaxID=765257 RepID=A0A0C9Z444_9AGAM|nr:hypothetical protein PISMIDRAFT_685462 [Pisolithus microcarpus 441]